jgi:hypothetical protein
MNLDTFSVKHVWIVECKLATSGNVWIGLVSGLEERAVDILIVVDAVYCYCCLTASSAVIRCCWCGFHTDDVYSRTTPNPSALKTTFIRRNPDVSLTKPQALKLTLSPPAVKTQCHCQCQTSQRLVRSSHTQYIEFWITFDLLNRFAISFFVFLRTLNVLCVFAL